MIQQTNNMGTAWVFTDEECADYAYICACMPSDRMTAREVRFVGQMEVKFRSGKGGWLTQGQWDWFAEVAQKYGTFIQGKEYAVEDIRALVAKVGRGDE